MTPSPATNGAEHPSAKAKQRTLDQMIDADDFTGATPGQLVEFHKRLHRKAYGAPLQMGDAAQKKFAELLASLRDRTFADVNDLVGFMRWTFEGADDPTKKPPKPLFCYGDDALTAYFVDLAREGSDLPALGNDAKQDEASEDFEFAFAAEVAKPLPPQRYLCRALGLARGRPSLLSASHGVGKTLLAQGLELDVARGNPTTWGGIPIELSGKVRHFDYEATSELTYPRFQRLAHAMGIDLVSLGDLLGIATLPRITLTSAVAEEAFVRALDGVVLAVIDNLRAATPGQKENESEFRQWLDLLTRVTQRTGCFILVLAHDGKDSDRGTRGSSGIGDAAGARVAVTADDGVLTLTPTKASACQLPPPVRVRIVDVGEVTSDFEAETAPGYVPTSPGLAIVMVGEDEPTSEAKAVAAAKQSIRDLLRKGPQPKSATLEAAKGRTEVKREALRQMIEDGEVIADPGARGAKVCRLANATVDEKGANDDHPF